LGDSWIYSRDLFPADWSREDALEIARRVDPETVRKLRPCGTPREAAAFIQPWIEAGVNHVLIFDYFRMAFGSSIGGPEATLRRLIETCDHLRVLNGQQTESDPA
jgi:alkanesulfonate monooxygenase SsuD/methylene tetrahydromethanopterin reductase-like flavin-dependent oxidoreductase (luciferase family)